MAISKKPKPQSVTDVNQFIEAGSTTESERKEQKPKKKTVQTTIVIPTELLEEIDAALSDEKPRLNRTQWILKACYERLEKSKPKGE